MPQELQAGPVTLLQLFRSEREYVSPLFQRQYVWGRRELKKLWEDVDEILEGSVDTRFLGAVVLEVKSSGLAFQPESSWIVDGQQRLTTLFLTLLRIAREAERSGAEELAQSVYKQYLFNQDGAHRNKPKLHTTLMDSSQFNNLFCDVSLLEPRLGPAFGEANGALSAADSTTQLYVRERCFVGRRFDESRAKNLLAALLEKLKFVQIVLSDGEDPHQVFDSLNAQGVRLENKDLIRNIVFQRLADEPDEAQAIYNARWLPFEQQLADRLDDYFFPFALIHKPSATKSSLLGTLRTRWQNVSPIDVLQDLDTYVGWFKALTAAKPVLGPTGLDKLDRDIERLRRMPTPSATLPFCMRVLEEWRTGSLSEEWACRNLELVESFLVRRAVAGFEPTGLHAVFKNLWNDTLGDPSLFVTKIDANPTVQFPEDDVFDRDIREKPLYGRRLAKYILAEYERDLVGGDPYLGGVLTIDHVMPQELTPAWSNIVSDEDHKRLKDTWANLVPLSHPANAEKGRMLWNGVRDFFRTETVYKSTKRLAEEYEEWGPDAIRKRAAELADWALQRWPKHG